MENQTELNEAFLKAVMNGDFDKIAEALTNGADLNATTAKGNNALYVAASRMRKDVFEWLLTVEQKGKKINLDNQNSVGGTALFEFVREGNMEEYVEKIIQAGANTEIAYIDHTNALIQAVGDNKLLEAKLLLEGGANANYVVKDSKSTPYLMATTLGNISMVKLLEEYNADKDGLDKYGKNALQNALLRSERFMRAKEKEDFHAMCAHLIENTTDVDYAAPSGATALWLASMKRDKAATMQILEKGAKADVWHEMGVEGQESALHIWCKVGDPEVVKALVDKGARLGAADYLGNVPEAYGFANPYLRDLMFELGADVNAVLYQQDEKKNRVPSTILSQIIHSAGDNSLELVQKMLDEGASPTTAGKPGLEGSEPIVAAIATSAKGVAELLMNTGKVNPDFKFKPVPKSPEINLLSLIVMGINTSKMDQFLAQKKQLEIYQKAREDNKRKGVVSDLISEEEFNKMEQDIKAFEEMERKLDENKKAIFDLLIKNKANVNAQNSEGHSALFFAKKPQYVQWLIDAGADLFLKDNEDLNPLINAVKNDSPIMDSLKSYYEMHNDKTIENIFYQLAFIDVKSSYVQESMKSGILNFLGGEDVAARVYAKPATPEEKIEPFVAPNINYQDEDGNTGLLVAAANNMGFLVSFYHKLGADLNLSNVNGETPLMHAIANGHINMVNYMIENGASVNAQTNEGKTVLEFAEEVENKEMIEKVKIAMGYQMQEGDLSGYKRMRP